MNLSFYKEFAILSIYYLEGYRISYFFYNDRTDAYFYDETGPGFGELAQEIHLKDKKEAVK